MAVPFELRGSLEPYPCFQLYLGWRRAQAFYRPWLEDGLNPQRMYVLGLLAERGSLGVGELARALDVELASGSGLVSRMEREGLVTRRRSESNRREVKVALTPRGRRRQRRFAAEVERADERLLAALDPADVAALRRVVATLGELIGESGREATS